VTRLTIWTRYWLERAVLRGSLSLVLILICLLMSIALAGGSIAYLVPGNQFESLDAALWWAVLRISDPGYLSDDTNHLGVRVLSVALSVLGMAVTVGGIVAIVTQWMNLGLSKLAAATTPVPFRNHFVLIGWTDRTPRLVESLLTQSESMIVVLIEARGPEEIKRISRKIQKVSHSPRVVVRGGTPYQPAGLARAACQDARGIIFPATERAVAGDPEEGPHLLRSALALRTLLARRETRKTNPTVVMELVDRSLSGLVRSALPRAHVLPSDRVIARAMRLVLQEGSLVDLALNVVRPDRPPRVQAHVDESLVGEDLLTIGARVQGGDLMGIIRKDGRSDRLVVDEGARFEAGDQLMVLSEGSITLRKMADVPPRTERAVSFEERETLRILVLGFNEVAPDLAAELEREPPERYEIDFLSALPVDAMKREVEELLVRDEQVRVRYFQGNPQQLDRETNVDLSRYDRFLVLADRSMGADRADVRTLAVALELGRVRDRFKPDAQLLLELLDVENLEVMPDAGAICTPLLAADVLSSLALSDTAMQTLTHTFLHQSSYITRLVFVERKYEKDEWNLRRVLLKSGLGFLRVHDTPDSKASKVAVLVVEPISRAQEPEASATSV
jgi:hypothetical protein